MKLTPRNAATTRTGVRITAPEWRRDPKTDDKILLLGFIDESGNQNHVPTTEELYLLAAGHNVENRAPDGLDRLSDHRFVVHLNADGIAIGLDIIPTRQYRSKVVPVSQAVDHVRVTWKLNGAVCQIVQRPAAVKNASLLALPRALERMAQEGIELEVGTRIEKLGMVEAVGLNTADISMDLGISEGRPMFDVLGEKAEA